MASGPALVKTLDTNGGIMAAGNWMPLGGKAGAFQF
jgi:hypothetical protein